MKPLHSNRAENKATGYISKSRRLSRTKEKQVRERSLLPRSGQVYLWAEELDIPTLLKTAQAISSEVRLEELLKKLLCFALENTGTEESVLLLDEQGRWIIRAISRPDHLDACLGQPQRLEDTEEVPAEVIQYVKRIREAVVLHNARLYQQLEQKVEEQTRVLEEIAERERAEQALRRQGHLFRTLVEHSPDIIARYDRNLRHLYMSPTIEAVTGRTPQEYIGRTLAELGIPEQRYHLWNRALRNVFETGRSDRFLEFDNPASDQTRKYQSRLIPEFADDGSVVSVLSITSDITELKQAEEAMRKSERFARSILDALSENICVLDETGTIVATNQAWHKFAVTSSPVPLHAAEGTNYLTVCDAATDTDAREAQAFAAGIRSVISGERNEFCMEYPCNTSTEPRWFAGRVTRFPGDGPVRLVVAQEDITERKWTEQALRESIELAETAQQEAERAERGEEKRRQEAERRRQIAESLRDIVSILNSNRPLDEVLDYILSQAGSMLGSQASAIYCLSGKNGGVIFQAAQGLSGDELSNAMRSTTQHGLEAILLTPWPVTISDIAAIVISQDDPGPVIPDLLVLAPPVDAYRALLAVPILIKDEVYGRLRLYYRDPHIFSDEEAELAIAFSDQVALAIETARLREQAKQTAVAEERNRLARDLHDSVTQTIFSAHLIAETLLRVWESHPEEGRCGLHELHRLIQAALAEMRTLLLELRPAAIVEKKLGELLKQLTQTTASQTSAGISLTVEGDRTLPAEVHIAFYRIAQEALNNIIKHARASHIAVKLYSSLDSVVLRVSDNGCGFDVSAIPPDHLGVSIIRERAVGIGATFALTSQPGHGAEVLITWQEPTGGQAHD